jgi:hypothetical protein
MHLAKNHTRIPLKCCIVEADVKYLYFITHQTDK